jgi:hypothetical protein
VPHVKSFGINFFQLDDIVGNGRLNGAKGLPPAY